MMNLDPFRREIGSVWHNASDGSGLKFGKKIAERPFKMAFGAATVMQSCSPPFAATHQVVKVTANPKRFGLYPECIECGWPEYIRSLINTTPWANNLTPQEAVRFYLDPKSWFSLYAPRSPSGDPSGGLGAYRDCFFSYEAPLSVREAKLLNSSAQRMVGDVDFNYNHYLENYEKAIGELNLPENRLPNFYLSLSGKARTEIIAALIGESECREKNFIKLLSENVRTLLIPAKNANFLNQLNLYQDRFPWNSEVKFTTDQVTSVAPAVNAADLDASLLRKVSETPPDAHRGFTGSKEVHATRRGRHIKKVQVNKEALKAHNLIKWLGDMKDPAATKGEPETLPEGTFFIGPSNAAIKLSLAPQDSFRKIMAILVMTGKLKDIMTSYNRSFQEIVEGYDSHSETIIYRIDKYNADLYSLYEKAMSDNGLTAGATKKLYSHKFPDHATAMAEDGVDPEVLASILTETTSGRGVRPIQSIYVANSNELDLFEYIDTQLNYGKEYTYEVTAYQLVIGSEYFYSNQPPCTDGWNVDLSQFGELTTELQRIIDEGSTMLDSYNMISAFLSARGLKLPEYCGGDLTLTITEVPGGFPASVTLNCICPDLGSSPGDNGKKHPCKDLICCMQKQSQQAVSNQDLNDDRLKRRVLSWFKKYTGMTLNRAYNSMLASGMNPITALKQIKSILNNIIEYKMDFSCLGLEAIVTDSGSTIDFDIIRQWAISSTSSASKTGEEKHSGEAIPTMTATSPGVSIQPNSNTNTLPYPFEVMEDCENDLDPCEEMFSVISVPEMMVYEVPYFVYGGAMIDEAPPPPGVEIIPYKGIPDKLLFNFNPGLGDYYERPIIINPREIRDVIKNLANYQGKARDYEIRFKADDPPKSFEIFRITKKPRKYTDFSNALLKRVDTDYSKRSLQKADSASFRDTLVPNTKYYYTFRTIDVHNHRSNPSDIYEVEIVENDGAVYPLIRIVELGAENPLPISKEMMKLIQIIPKISQAVVNEEASGYTLETESALKPGRTPIVLGTQEDSVWGKKFKIRLTSKCTARKLDLNLFFKTEHVRNPSAPCDTDMSKAIISIAAGTDTETLGTTGVASASTAMGDEPAVATASTTYTYSGN